MNRISRATSFALVFTLFFGPLIRAQTPVPLQLQVRMVAGIDATYEAGSLQSSKLVVEVTDQAGVPVPDVAVTFRLPEDGATGVFADGNRSSVIYTSKQGEAAVSGIRWGATPGTLSLRITAVKGSAHAGILAPQELIVGARTVAATVAPARTAPALISAPAAASKPIAAAEPSAETVAAPPPSAPRVSTQVTILTNPEKAKAEPVVRTAIAPLPTAAEAKPKDPPAVAISSAPPGHGSGKAKWVLIGLIAAGAVAGVGFAMGGKSSTTAAVPVPGTSIGAPSVSIGHP